MTTRGAAEYQDYLRQCEAKGEEPKVFICPGCDHPLKSKDDKCPQCDGGVVC
jgi:rubrerythrin